MISPPEVVTSPSIKRSPKLVSVMAAPLKPLKCRRPLFKMFTTPPPKNVIKLVIVSIGEVPVVPTPSGESKTMAFAVMSKMLSIGVVF